MPSSPLMPPVTLHLGVHRTGTSAIQERLAFDDGILGAHDIAVRGPDRTRAGLLDGLLGDPGASSARRDVRTRRAVGRLSILREDLQKAGVRRLILTDQNILGNLRENVLLGRLYPTARGRLERLRQALPGIDRVVLSIRSPDDWWTSVFACMLERGFAPPDRATLDAVLTMRRTWRDVLADVATALPDARLTVWTHEAMAADPHAALRDITGLDSCTCRPGWVDASPDAAGLQTRLRDEGCPIILRQAANRYAPFAPDERLQLRSHYEDDLAWLRDGADGLIDAAAGYDLSAGEGRLRDRRPRHGQYRRQDQVGAAG